MKAIQILSLLTILFSFHAAVAEEISGLAPRTETVLVSGQPTAEDTQTVNLTTPGPVSDAKAERAADRLGRMENIPASADRMMNRAIVSAARKEARRLPLTTLSGLSW